jgi:hypothetical protein
MESEAMAEERSISTSSFSTDSLLSDSAHTTEDFRANHVAERDNLSRWFPVPTDNDGVYGLRLHLLVNILSTGMLSASNYCIILELDQAEGYMLPLRWGCVEMKDGVGRYRYR